MSDEGMRQVLEALAEPALVIESGTVSVANSGARDLFGGQIEGRSASEVISPPNVPDAVLAAASGDFEVSGVGGVERSWTLSIRSLGPSTSLVRLVDRSATVAAEKMRVDFVANASHELRTPLSTLLGYAETLRENAEDVDDPTRERFLAVIHDEARRMQRLVEDLISLSRIESERFSAPRDPVDLAGLARESAASWRARAEETGSTIALDAEDGLPPTMGDRNQLMQLLDNLISNALRYGRPATPVRIAMRREGRMVLLAVSDEGEGIAAKHIPRITERFYRVDKARSRDSGGTGLGLSIVKHIVERHGGRLDIRSQPGRGTEVRVLLPAAAGGQG